MKVDGGNLDKPLIISNILQPPFYHLVIQIFVIQNCFKITGDQRVISYFLLKPNNMYLILLVILFAEFTAPEYITQYVAPSKKTLILCRIYVMFLNKRFLSKKKNHKKRINKHKKKYMAYIFVKRFFSGKFLRVRFCCFVYLC